MILLLACASPPSAELYARALDEGTPIDEALAACSALTEASEECTTAVVAQRGADPAVCQELSGLWREECHFRVAERLTEEGDRYGALIECGYAGRFYDECLYHSWSRELQRAVEPDSTELSRGVDHEAKGAEVVEYFRGVRTIRQDAEVLLWNDFWFFAHNRNRPARLADCADSLDQQRCIAGTENFVARLTMEGLTRAYDPSELARFCRSGEVPPSVLDGAFEADERLDGSVQLGLWYACQTPPVRPWSPSFVPLRQR